MVGKDRSAALSRAAGLVRRAASDPVVRMVAVALLQAAASRLEHGASGRGGDCCDSSSEG